MRLLKSRILVRGRLQPKDPEKGYREPVPVGALVRLKAPSDSHGRGRRLRAATNKEDEDADAIFDRPLRREYSFCSRMQLLQDQNHKDGRQTQTTGDLEGRGTVTVELDDSAAPRGRGRGIAWNAKGEEEQQPANPPEPDSSVPGTISGRLLQHYCYDSFTPYQARFLPAEAVGAVAHHRKEAEEMLMVSEQLPGSEAWRVLPELQRLLVLRRGHLSCMQKGEHAQRHEEEEDCMRQCLARLAALKTEIAASATDMLRVEAEASASEKTAARQGAGGAAARLADKSPPGAPAVQGSPLSQQEQQGIQDTQALQHAKQITGACQTSIFLDKLLDVLELATAYATRGKTHPAVYLQIAALRPAVIYETLSSWQVRLILLQIFQRLWLQFAAFSIRNGGYVSSALLVLDFGGLTHAECTSPAMHWLMTDLRQVMKACCPLLVQSVVFCGCRVAGEYLWEMLRPFVYHQLLDAAYGSDILPEWLPYVTAMPAMAHNYTGSGGRRGPALLQTPVPADACRDSGTAWLEETLDDLLHLLLRKHFGGDSNTAPDAASKQAVARKALRAQSYQARLAANAVATAAARVLPKSAVQIVQLAALAFVPITCRSRQERQAEERDQQPTLSQHKLPEQLCGTQRQETNAAQKPLTKIQWHDRDRPSYEAVQQQQAVVRGLWRSLVHRESCWFWRIMQVIDEEARISGDTTLQQQTQKDRIQPQQRMTIRATNKRAVPYVRPGTTQVERRTRLPSWLQPSDHAGASPKRSAAQSRLQSDVRQEQHPDLVAAEKNVESAAHSSLLDFIQSVDQAALAIACDSWRRRRLAAGLSAEVYPVAVSGGEGAVIQGRARAARWLKPVDLDSVSRRRVSFRSLLEPIL